MKKPAILKWYLRDFNHAFKDWTTMREIREACDTVALSLDPEAPAHIHEQCAMFDLIVPVPYGQSSISPLSWTDMSMFGRQKLGFNWMECDEFPKILALRQARPMKVNPHGEIRYTKIGDVIGELIARGTISSSSFTGTAKDVGKLMAQACCDCSNGVPSCQVLRVGYFFNHQSESSNRGNGPRGYMDFCL